MNGRKVKKPGTSRTSRIQIRARNVCPNQPVSNRSTFSLILVTLRVSWKVYYDSFTCNDASDDPTTSYHAAPFDTELRTYSVAMHDTHAEDPLLSDEHNASAPASPRNRKTFTSKSPWCFISLPPSYSDFIIRTSGRFLSIHP